MDPTKCISSNSTIASITGPITPATTFTSITTPATTTIGITTPATTSIITSAATTTTTSIITPVSTTVGEVMDPIRYMSTISTITSTTTTTVQSFPMFFECWIKQLEDHLQTLVATRKRFQAHNHNRPQQQNSNSEESMFCEVMASKFTTHHKAYYTAKWEVACRDVLTFYSPTWISPMQYTQLWLTGWKPTSTIFRLVESLQKTRAPLTSLVQLSDGQRKQVETLRVKIKAEEDRMENEMERQQVAIADWKMVKRCSSSGGGESSSSGIRRDEEESVRIMGVLTGLEMIMRGADVVRLKALKGLLNLLTPRQGLDLLAVFSMVLIQQNKRGKMKTTLDDHQAQQQQENKRSKMKTTLDDHQAQQQQQNKRGKMKTTLDDHQGQQQQ